MLRMLLVATVVMATLAACATIPRSGPVKAGGSISEQDNGLGPVDYIPSGPTPGASQQDVLLGFINAAVSPQGGYQIAREFLTSGFDSRWNPDASVTVDAGSDRSYVKTGDTTRQVAVTPVAYVDANGNFRRAESSVPIPLAYSFKKEGGEWRISKAPNGIVIDDAQFTDVFSAHPLYFYSPDYAYLVPDERWFPTSPESTRTRVAKALISGGPAKWLDGAVVTAFPQGSQLTVDSVTLVGGVAQIPLNSTAGGADQLTLERMKLQLSQSLESAASVASVRITIEGVERNIPDLGDRAPVQNPPVDSNPLVLRDGVFGFLSGNAVVPIPDISDKVESLTPTQAALAADRSAAAVLAAHGVYAVRDSADAPQLVDARGGVIAPGIDNDGYVWSVPGAQPSALQAAGATGASLALSVDWPDATSIQSIAVSRDGTRLAALVTADGQQHIMAAGIVRDDSGKPTKLSGPADFGTTAGGTATSLAWLDELTVAALASSAKGESTLTLQTIGGDAENEPGPSNGIQVVGGNGSSMFWVRTSDGTLQWPRGTGWQQKANGIGLLGTQQGRP
jgi:hypothetical protein